MTKVYLVLLSCISLFASAQDQPIAKGLEKFLGSAYSNPQTEGFNKYWNQVTPENAGKWGSVERVRDVMNWGQLDAAYSFAKENGYYFKFHVLVWGNQQPAWIEDLSTEEQLEEINEWFAAVAERYPDIDAIEVVNEPISDPPNQKGNGGGNYLGALGPFSGSQWLLGAFRMARTHFPNTKLMINEYNIVNNNARLQRYLSMVNQLKAEDLIDYIGIQVHTFSTAGVSSDMLKTSLDRLSVAGLPIFVTEMDIEDSNDQAQLNEYQRIFPIFWEHSSVQGITLWGFRPGLWRSTANLINSDGTERPALRWLRQYAEYKEPALSIPKETSNLTVFPNPVNKKTLKISGMENIQKVDFLDLSGKKVLEVVPQNGLIKINKSLNSGIYMLRLKNKVEVKYKRVLIEE